MECEERKRRLSGWILLALAVGQLWLLRSADAEAMEGEFVAGSFILTQKSLNEAPYRYAGVLRKALDKVETKDPPSKSDEENCSVRYRIRPSGRRSKLRIIENTLTITLKENNTVVVGAKLDAEVAARTWIWKGISFGLLGCLKLNSCNGKVVTYTAHIDFSIAFAVNWDEEQKKLGIKIKPVQTAIKNVNVAGCRPPWYLFWFKQWQSLLNDGVQEAFQEFADNYEKISDVPEGFAPHKDVYIHYKVTGMTWRDDVVMFHANASFSTLVDGKNKTFIPSDSNGEVNAVPLEDNWPMRSPTDEQSHLLQGIRISTEFLNSLMWYATVQNKTRYHGSARVLDSNINGTVSYTPPNIRVERDNLLHVGIGHGLMLATCFPVNETDEEAGFASTNSSEGEILFKAEFTDLSGSGRVQLASTKDQTGIKISLDQLDLSRMSTKPFEPKLPLPETFETELMKNGISQLQPMVNQYLQEKPLYLPENIAPFAASPQLYLWNTGNGTGFVEILSYCTCKEGQDSSVFAQCDSRSHICDGGQVREHKVEGIPTTEKSGIVPKIVQDGIKSIVAVANGVVNSNRNGREHEPHPPHVNFTQLFEEATKDQSLYKGYHMTFFEEDPTCRLDVAGYTAKVYWLWQTGQCSPLYLHGKETSLYYRLNGTDLDFGCLDSDCEACDYTALHMEPEESGLCHMAGTESSYQLGAPDIDSWYGNDTDIDNIIVNAFFAGDEFCALHPRYVEPQLLSSHSNLGKKKSQICRETASGDYANAELANETVVEANWGCIDACFGCEFRVKNVPFAKCHPFSEGIEGIRLKFTTSTFKMPDPNRDVNRHYNEHAAMQKTAIYVAIGCAIALTFIVVGIVAVLRNTTKKKSPSRVQGRTSSKEGAPTTEDTSSWTDSVRRCAGNRFATYRANKEWSKSKLVNEVRDDLLQNCMLIANGSLSITFAYEWNSDNNPLLIINNKFQDGLTVSVEMLDTTAVAEFADRLNFLTYLVNVGNAVVAFAIVIIWCVTKSGEKAAWMKARLLSSISMLAGIFVVIAAVIFSTYFDQLVVLRRDLGHFITDNDSMHSAASQVMAVSLNGLSLTVVSFTIVFLFHSVGGGLYCGTVLFRLLNLGSKRENLEILTTLLVILTVIQPFICIHPVIVWSQDSNNNSTFLLLVILIWFLPIAVHVVSRAVSVHGRPKWTVCANDGSGEKSIRVRLRDGSSIKYGSGDEHHTRDKGASTRRRILVTFFDIFVQVLQLTFFLVTFSIITHYIIHTEFGGDRKNLREFVMPAITSVFVWMVAISYLLLAIVMDRTKKQSRLVFKDQDLNQARKRLKETLRRRLADMDDRSSRARTMNHTRHRQKNSIIAEETISLSDSMTKGQNRRRTMPAEVNLGQSMRGRRVLPSDSHVMTVTGSGKRRPPSELKGGEEAESELGARITDRPPRVAQLPPMNPKPRLPPWPPTAPKPRFHRPAPPKPELPPKPNLPQAVVIERGKKLGREKFREIPIPDDDPQNDLNFPPKSDSRDADGGERDVLGESTTTVNTTVSSLAALLDGEGGGGWWARLKRVYHFFMETKEYADPHQFGWRIKFRRAFLSVGVLMFTYLTVYTAVSTQNFSSKEEIQQLLDYAGANLTWPDSGSVLDDVFQLYNKFERTKSYIMVGSSVLFWASLAFDLASYFVRPSFRSLLFTLSRVTNFFGSLAVFAAVIVVGLPDYLAASHLDDICPFCGVQFNKTVKQAAEFSIGLFFACLFTFQLMPILITIVPALVRASVLILIHPSLAVDENEVTTLRMNILQQVVQFSSLLTFPITFVSMAILQQYQKDIVITALILLFWTFPPSILFLGLHYTRKYKRYTILLYVYYMYNICYFALLFSLVLYSLNMDRIVELIRGLLTEPNFWASSMSQVALCNVVISDMLYMTVF